MGILHLLLLGCTGSACLAMTSVAMRIVFCQPEDPDNQQLQDESAATTNENETSYTGPGVNDSKQQTEKSPLLPQKTVSISTSTSTAAVPPASAVDNKSSFKLQRQLIVDECANIEEHTPSFQSLFIGEHSANQGDQSDDDIKNNEETNIEKTPSILKLESAVGNEVCQNEIPVSPMQPERKSSLPGPHHKPLYCLADDLPELVVRREQPKSEDEPTIQDDESSEQEPTPEPTSTPTPMPVSPTPQYCPVDDLQELVVQREQPESEDAPILEDDNLAPGFNPTAINTATSTFVSTALLKVDQEQESLTVTNAQGTGVDERHEMGSNDIEAHFDSDAPEIVSILNSNIPTSQKQDLSPVSPTVFPPLSSSIQDGAVEQGDAIETYASESEIKENTDDEQTAAIDVPAYRTKLQTGTVLGSEDMVFQQNPVSPHALTSTFDTLPDLTSDQVDPMKIEGQDVDSEGHLDDVQTEDLKADTPPLETTSAPHASDPLLTADMELQQGIAPASLSTPTVTPSKNPDETEGLENMIKTDGQATKVRGQEGDVQTEVHNDVDIPILLETTPELGAVEKELQQNPVSKLKPVDSVIPSSFDEEKKEKPSEVNDDVEEKNTEQTGIAIDVKIVDGTFPVQAVTADEEQPSMLATEMTGEASSSKTETSVSLDSGKVVEVTNGDPKMQEEDATEQASPAAVGGDTVRRKRTEKDRQVDEFRIPLLKQLEDHVMSSFHRGADRATGEIDAGAESPNRRFLNRLSRRSSATKISMSGEQYERSSSGSASPVTAGLKRLSSRIRIFGFRSRSNSNSSLDREL